MHQALEEFTKNKKMLPYEISNYACAGHESEHNCHYWNYDSFIGLGAGAVSFLRREEISDEAWKKIGIEAKEDLYGLRFTNPYSLNDYGECSSSFEKCIIEPISLSTAMGEFMMMGLRKRSGIRYSDFENKFGVIFPKRFMGLVQRAFENGLAIVNEEGCWLSKRGVMLSNEVMQEFIGDGVGDMILAS
jgi:oxygen-independent coproporphyrinogen-3 oxidase